jgi:hypothetical protein
LTGKDEPSPAKTTPEYVNVPTVTRVACAAEEDAAIETQGTAIAPVVDVCAAPPAADPPVNDPSGNVITSNAIPSYDEHSYVNVPRKTRTSSAQPGEPSDTEGDDFDEELAMAALPACASPWARQTARERVPTFTEFDQVDDRW